MSIKMNYIHTHSEISNVKSYDALNKLSEIPRIVHEKGSTAAFLTDHDHLGGSVKFLKAVEEIRKKDPKFKGVIGNEIYLTRDGLTKETWEKGERLNHLILIAKNRKGWEVLNELSSHAWGHSFTHSLLRTPTYRGFLEKIMKEKGKGNIIITTACIGGVLGKKILDWHQSKDEADKQAVIDEINWFKSFTAEGDFYLEVQPATYQDQKIYNSWLAAFSEATNTPLVVSTDAHYEKEEHFNIHNSFLNSQEKFSNYRETKDFYQFTYFMEPNKVESYLLECPNLGQEEVDEAIENTLKIAEKCEHYSIESPAYLMETQEREDGWKEWLDKNIDKHSEICKRFYSQEEEINKYFLYEVLKSLEEKIEKGWVKREQRTYDRIDEELETIMDVSEVIHEQLGKYFQTMKEMMSIIWEVSVVGPGRGSAGASLICFVLDITAVNPLTVLPGQELPFWRFAHKSRPEMADIDWDSGSSLKEEIIDKLSKWAKENNHTIAKVATFGTLKSKKALQVSAKGLGYEPEDILYFSSLVPVERGFPKGLKDCLAEEKMFKEAYREHPTVIDNAIKLEGLIVSMGSHAAAITFFKDEDKFSRCSFVKTPKDAVFSTCFDLEDLDEVQAAIKFDMLQTSAVDSIQTTMMLLVEDGLIEWQGNLKSTYDKYFHPSVIDETNPKLWDKVKEQEIIGLFQYDTPQGSQAIEQIQPESLTDLVHGNSAMRLMASDSHPELPLITFAKQKENINLWYQAMAQYGLDENEVKLMEKYLADSYGMCIDQETIMKMSMDENISGFSVAQANKLRKAIAKKKIEIMEEVKEIFYRQGEGRASKKLLDYVWNEAFLLSAGYGFSMIHSVLYSYIAIQQAHMNTIYPPIYWNTARLLVESKSIQFLDEQLEFLENDEDEEESTSGKKNINYFKMASAIGKVRKFGIEIEKPNINKSLFTFRADAEHNKIWFGLRGISRIGQDIIQTIIENRPYTSMEDLLTRVKLDKTQTMMLIKAGALDDFGDRVELFKDYCKEKSNPKKELNLRNVNGLLSYGLFPEELKKETDFFRIYNHCKKFFKFGDMIVPDENMWQYLQAYAVPTEQSDSGELYIQITKFKKYYDNQMLPIKKYIKENHDELLQQFNNCLYQDEIDKYAKDFNIPAWEMEALSMYYGDHELDHDDYKYWLRKMGVQDFEDLPEEPIVEWEGEHGGKMFRLFRIAGTCVGRDKSKYTAGILTTDGFVEVKVHRERFLKYDRQIKEDGKTEPSWWSKGQKVILTGYRNGENKFMVKTYKRTSSPAVAKIIKPGLTTTKRMGEM